MKQQSRKKRPRRKKQQRMKLPRQKKNLLDLVDLEVPQGGPIVHSELEVAGRRVPWWVAGDVVHCEDTTEGLARALAWTTGRWADRHLLAALLDDPDNYVS